MPFRFCTNLHTVFFSLSLIFALGISTLNAKDVIVYQGITFNRYEIPFYTFAEYTPQLALRMDYANFEVSKDDLAAWQELTPNFDAYEIDLIFTLYPKDINAWRTNYDELLSNRIKVLLETDPSLKNKRIHWNMILQTQCNNEPEAKRYYHGFVIKYQPKDLKVINEIKSPKDLKSLIAGYARTEDSTVHEVLNRNPQWEDMLVVSDWTGSMYKYGVQLVQWHKNRLQTHTSRVKYFIFFNDGNNLRTTQKKLGKTGGVYRARTNELEEIVKTMLFVMRKGNGGDTPENDIEAILTGVQYLDNFGDVLLIADNKSAVRDISLLEKINVPIRVIICDQKEKIHPHYLRLAHSTGGSIHTIEEDYYDIRLSQKGLLQP